MKNPAVKDTGSMVFIDIGEAVSLDELDTWSARTAQTITFKLHASSGFAPLAEGVAVGLLRTWKEQLCRFQFTCTYDLVEHKKANRTYGIIDGLFGMTLLTEARIGQDRSGTDITKIRSQVWADLQDNNGGVGDKWQRSLLCRDPDYSIPRWIQGQLKKSSPQNTSPSNSRDAFMFPDSSEFRLGLNEMVKHFSIRENEDYSVTERDVVQFLYQTFQNSHQHGRTAQYKDHTGSYKKVRNGVRGLILDKIRLDVSSHPANEKYPAPLREYLKRTAELKSTNIFFSYTVADIGQGIHRTLPDLPTGELETDYKRLNRAFRAGETSLPSNTVLDRGQGLAKVASSCDRLKAFLFVRSGTVLAYRDFSSAHNIDELLLPWPVNVQVGSEGTSLTLIWPHLVSGGDQYALFE